MIMVFTNGFYVNKYVRVVLLSALIGLLVPFIVLYLKPSKTKDWLNQNLDKIEALNQNIVEISVDKNDNLLIQYKTLSNLEVSVLLNEIILLKPPCKVNAIQKIKVNKP